MISDELIKAYRTTLYKVYSPSLCIQVGVRNEILDTLLAEYNAQEWAFITAYNPYSSELFDRDNQARHQQLKEAVKSFVFFEGEGVGEDPAWQPEKSILIIGINQVEAIKIGNRLEQNAIVIGRINMASELFILQ